MFPILKLELNDPLVRNKFLELNGFCQRILRNIALRSPWKSIVLYIQLLRKREASQR